jgi:hypothetical protein
MRTAGALFDVTDEVRGVFVLMVMVDAAEVHRVPAARAADAVAVDNAVGAFVENAVTFGTAHPYLHVLDWIVHGIRSCTLGIMPRSG